MEHLKQSGDLYTHIPNMKEHDIEYMFFTENIFVTIPFLFMATEYIKKKLSDMVIERGYDYIGEAMCRTDEYCRNYIENIKGVNYNDDICIYVDINADDYITYLKPEYYCKCKSFAINGDIDSYIQEHTRMMGKMNSSSFSEFDKVYGNYSGMSVLRLHKYFLDGKDVDDRFRRELISRGYLNEKIPDLWNQYAYCCENCLENGYDY